MIVDRKNKYVKPNLTKHGDLKEITKGGGTVPGEPLDDPSIG
jgi:hypothetical protein